MRRIIPLAAVMVAALVAAAPASASWHAAGGTMKFDTYNSTSDVTVYAHYSIRAQVWGATPTGSGMAVRNFYMDRMQDGAVPGDYGAPIGLPFWYLGHWYRARIKASGWWLYVDRVRHADLSSTGWHMRLKVTYLGHTTYPAVPVASVSASRGYAVLVQSLDRVDKPYLAVQPRWAPPVF